MSVNCSLGQIGQIVSECGQENKGKLGRKVSFCNNLFVDVEDVEGMFCLYPAKNRHISTYFNQFLLIFDLSLLPNLCGARCVADASCSAKAVRTAKQRQIRALGLAETPCVLCAKWHQVIILWIEHDGNGFETPNSCCWHKVVR